MPPRRKSLVAIANEQVDFLKAAGWAGVGTGARDRGMKVTCPSCGEQGALRVYPGHAWCFSERRRFTAVSLLAEVWEMDREDAAIRALGKIGYVPASYAHLWEDAERAPEVAREELATALRTWCTANCPDWTVRQYEPAAARVLAYLLGLLSAVQTKEDCGKWLAAGKQAMGRALSRH